MLCPTKTPGTCHVCDGPAISELWTICNNCKPKLRTFEWDNECLRATMIQVRGIANQLARTRLAVAEGS